jgi:uncharacterized protein YjlB
MEKYQFKDDGITPNNQLPVLVFRAVNHNPYLADFFENTFKEAGWGNNWRDIINVADHYHSNTHEILGISKNRVRLKIGGAKGKEIELAEGDVVLIPAGVGHYSLDNSHPYEVVGGYPGGAEWDFILNDSGQYYDAKTRIKALPKYPKGLINILINLEKG